MTGVVRTGKYRADRVGATGITPTATVSIADVPELFADLRGPG
jgi:hypothetical protein